jgi:hypothetical protein
MVHGRRARMPPYAPGGGPRPRGTPRGRRFPLPTTLEAPVKPSDGSLPTLPSPTYQREVAGEVGLGAGVTIAQT